MHIQKAFLKTFQIWFGFFLSINLSSLFAISGLDPNDSHYSSLFAGISCNLVTAYLFLFYIIFQIKTGETETGTLYDEEKPFYQWVWFSDDMCHQTIIMLIFVLWFILNCLICSHMIGFFYITGIMSILSIVYWLIIIFSIVMSHCRSSKDTQPLII